MNQTAIVWNGNIYQDYIMQAGMVYLPTGEVASPYEVTILFQTFKMEDGAGYLEVIQSWGKKWAPAVQNPFYTFLKKRYKDGGDILDYLHTYPDIDLPVYFNIDLEPNKLYFGIELELMAPKSSKDLKELVNLIETMRKNELALPVMDGSVDLEVVTRPFTKEQVMKFIDDYKKFFNLIEVGEGVGFHVHISKDAFDSQLAMAYFTVVVNKAVASGKYNRLFGKPNQEWAEPKKKDLHKWESEGRYEAVNTLPNRTIEVRAFRATNDPEVMKDRINWLSRAVDWANSKAQS